MRITDWLPAAERAKAVERKLKAGETLFRQGDKSAGLYEVLRGRIRLCRVDRDGHEIVLHNAGVGESLAEASLFAAHYHCDAIAGSEATVRLFPKPIVLAVLARDRRAAQAFTAALARQVMGLRTRIEQRNIRSARERLRHYLGVNVGADGRSVMLTGTLKELAAELGLTHEALYRTLAALERAGEIARGRGRILLLRPRRPAR